MHLPKLEQLLQVLMQQARDRNPARTWALVSLVLMDDESITDVNGTYFNKPHPTDVISFTYDAMPGEDDGDSGEILVNVERAYSEGQQRDGSSAELALYVAHGCLHLNGMTDQAAADRDDMRHEEKRLLEHAAEAGLLADLMESAK